MNSFTPLIQLLYSQLRLLKQFVYAIFGHLISEGNKNQTKVEMRILFISMQYLLVVDVTNATHSEQPKPLSNICICVCLLWKIYFSIAISGKNETGANKTKQRNKKQRNKTTQYKRKTNKNKTYETGENKELFLLVIKITNVVIKITNVFTGLCQKKPNSME